MKKKKSKPSPFKETRYWETQLRQKKKTASRNGKSPKKGKTQAEPVAKEKPMADKKSDSAKSSAPSDPEAAKAEALEQIRKIDEDATIKAYEEGVKQGTPGAKPAKVAIEEAAKAEAETETEKKK